MKIGSLYRVKKSYWLLFSSKESATTTLTAPKHAVLVGPANAAVFAAYYSEKYNENVTWFPPESQIVFLGEDGKLTKVLTSDGTIGWTWITESFNDCFEEVST